MLISLSFNFLFSKGGKWLFQPLQTGRGEYVNVKDNVGHLASIFMNVVHGLALSGPGVGKCWAWIQIVPLRFSYLSIGLGDKFQKWLNSVEFPYPQALLPSPQMGSRVNHKVEAPQRTSSGIPEWLFQVWTPQKQEPTWQQRHKVGNVTCALFLFLPEKWLGKAYTLCILDICERDLRINNVNIRSYSVIPVGCAAQNSLRKALLTCLKV